MKKVHRKVIQVQASILRKMTKDIDSIKNGKTFYSKEERKEIRLNNGIQYRPEELRETIKHLKDSKAAKIFREIRLNDRYTLHLVYHVSGKIRRGRQYRGCGDLYSNKKIMCNALFPKNKRIK